MDIGNNPGRISRRHFIQSSAIAGLTVLAAGPAGVFAAQPDKIRVGVIGCGNRGTGAAIDCVHSSKNVELVALGDLFKDHLDTARTRMLKELGPEPLKYTDETCFAGFDSIKSVLACDLDMVILATPPHFRPAHFKAVIEAGKHVFMEKPVAVDPLGVRSVLATADLAKSKNLSVVAGTQRRHQDHYIQAMKRVHDGAIGELVGGQCYWNSGGMLEWGPKDQPEWSEMERQCRRWYFYTWLCGDHIVEQHVHNIDIINWAFGVMPEKCMGAGGRQVRTGPEYGNIFDHFTVEFEYPNGARVMSMCRQTDGAATRVAERIVGAKGYADLNAASGKIVGANAWEYDGKSPNPYVQEHADL
ncbi:MAG: Gfo/Idh/MocA family oxidoreductase, partial [bacterium]|nr:Gfo/Idh/MocA family oxidoreductase [bacterium]